MLVFPNCKINLGLFITNRREDGYHDLETVFYPVTGLKDALEMVPAKSGATTIHLSGKAVAGEQEKNLVWKAWQLLHEKFPGKVVALDMYLHKVIPMGAGMGGGSADGAFALRLINDLCKLALNEEQLVELALQLGSDCPFFIYNTPQFATGRGEKMQSVPVDLSAYSMQIVCPDIHVSTATAFRHITPKAAAYDLRHLHELPVIDWKDFLFNDFEQTVFAIHPELGQIKQQLYDAGAVYASMTGTGSAVYGIFEKGEKTNVIANTVYIY